MIPTVRVEQDIQSVAKSLEKKVGLAPLFYQNAPVVLDFEASEGKLESNNVVTLFNEIHRLNLIPVGITFTQDPIIQNLAKQYNIPFINSARAANRPIKDETSSSPPLSSSSSNSQIPPQKTEKMQIRTFSNTIQNQSQNTETHINSSQINETLSSSSPSSSNGFNLPTKDKTSSPITSNYSSPSPSLSSSSSPSPSFSPSSNTTQNIEENNNTSNSPPLIIKASLRSGQQVYARNGSDLIVMGSVHSGAEALADGSVHIYGALRGRALAGVSGNLEAKIFSGKFHAELISIGDTYCACEEQPPGTDPNKPSVVWLEDGNLKFSTMD